jgi:hypothetical protein
MPQLDCYFFFSMFATFQLFFVGLLFFSIFVVPHSIFFGKLSGGRLYYYYMSLLSVVSSDVDDVIVSHYRVISICLIVYMRIAIKLVCSTGTFRIGNEK